MGRGRWQGRPCYRVRQFVWAVRAALVPLSEADRAEARAVLPEAAWPLFMRMPRADQRHSLQVLRAVRAAGEVCPALLQAALLHDCAKYEAGLRLWHRVAVVLIKAFAPALWRQWSESAAPGRSSWRYPLWAHAHHPQRSAELAAGAGCDGLAVTLILHHQDPPGATGDPRADSLLAVLRTADDDN